MADLIFNRWFQLGAATTIAVVVGAVIGLLIAGSGTVGSVRDAAGVAATGEFSDDTGFVGPVMLRAGGGFQARGENESDVALGQDFGLELPITAAEAVAAGWQDPRLCRVGRGRYFQKGIVGEGEPYFLMYNNFDRLIGIYQFSETEMPPPWEQMDSLAGGSGEDIIDFEHWGLFVYFQDSTRACGKVSQTIQRGVQGKYLGTFVKSTPTPVVPPTPTPSAGQVLEIVVAKMAKVKSLSFTLTDDPEAPGGRRDIGPQGYIDPR